MRKMKRRQKKQLALLTAIVFVASIIAVMLLTPGFDIKEIEVRGNSVLTDEELLHSSGIVTGVNIFGVNLGEAEDNIMSLGYIENVKIKRSLPSTIEITVVEEVGVGYINAEDGYVIITADGRCIDITDGLKKSENDKNVASLPELPKIKGMKNVKYKVGKTITSENQEQLDVLFECLHEFSKQGYIFNMKEIDVSDINDIKFYYRNKDLCVTVGSVEKIAYKMECFGPILSQLGENPTGYINLERLTYRKLEEQPAEKAQDGQ